MQPREETSMRKVMLPLFACCTMLAFAQGAAAQTVEQFYRGLGVLELIQLT